MPRKMNYGWPQMFVYHRQPKIANQRGAFDRVSVEQGRSCLKRDNIDHHRWE